MDKDTVHAIFKKSGIHYDEKIFVAPHIPEKKLINAIQSHGLFRKCTMDDVLVLVDDTVFGSAKDGLVITSDFISWKEIFESPSRIDFKDISDIDVDGSALFINSKKIKFTCPEKTNIYKLYKALDEILDIKNTDIDDGGEDDEIFESENNQNDDEIDLLSLQLGLVNIINDMEKESVIIMNKVKNTYHEADNLRKSDILKKAGSCAIETGYYYARFLLIVQLKNLVDEYSPEISALKAAGVMNYFKSLIYLCDLFEKNSTTIKKDINNYYSESFLNRLEKEIKSCPDEARNFLDKFKGYTENYAGLVELFQSAYDNEQYFQVTFFGSTQFVIQGAIYYILQQSMKSRNANDKLGIMTVFIGCDSIFDDAFWKEMIKSEYSDKVFN